MRLSPALFGSLALVPLLLFGAVSCGDDTSATASSTTATTAATSGDATSTSGAGGQGGEGGNGGAGGGGSPCTPVSVGEKQLVDAEPGGSSVAFSLLGLDPSVEHVLFVEFFDVAGAQVTGSFDLSAPPDDNYETCAHCLLAFEDVNSETPTVFYPRSGTLVVTTADTDYTGTSAGVFQDVELVQVTLEGTTTVPVVEGRCLTLTGGWDTALP